MRLPIAAVCFGCVLLGGAFSSAQSAPTSQSLCDMPSNTPYYTKYCGGGTAPQAVPAGPTPQQQMGLALGQAAMPYLQQAVHDLLWGAPAKPLDTEQLHRQLAAQQLNNAGIYLLKQRNYAGAIHEFEQALALTPNDPNILHNLGLARHHIKDTAVAGQTSADLGQFLGNFPRTGLLGFGQLTYPSIANPSRSALGLFNLDPSVVDLRSATRPSPESLKGQLDGLLGHATVSAPPDPLVDQPQAQDIDLLFQPPQSAPSAFPGPQRPANEPKPLNPMDAEQHAAEVDAIFAKPGGVDDLILQKIQDDALSGIAKPAPAKPTPVEPHN